ncbi:MAG: polysaccharide pyruvyl transferase family protein [Actinomycetota bacterium]|jgi:colanic acid/amylovoran biosynthesis protein|nr:polysaccharide pyruvyl transferase family protein [Actinomycetota bacterium]
MSRIVFVGAYGLHSQGDDAALLNMWDALRARLKHVEGYVITRHAVERPYEKYGLHSVQNIEYDSKSESVGRWFRGLNYADDHSILDALTEIVASSDLMVIGAGNAYVDTVIDMFRGPLPYYTLMAMLARMTGVPYMLYGVTVGPLNTEYGRRLTYLSADLAAAVTVRDSLSAEWFRELGYKGEITKVPDPVLGLSPVQSGAVRYARSREGGLRIGVSVRDIRGSVGSERNEELQAELAAVVRSAVERLGATVLFFPQCTYPHGNAWEDDRVVARAIADRLGDLAGIELIEDDLSVGECLELYGDLDAAVCMRLHANVYAAIQGVPSIAIDNNTKVAAFMEWLCAGERVVGVDRLEPGDVLDGLQAVLEDRETISQDVRKRVEHGRQEVQRYADIASTLVSRTEA